MTHYSTYLNLHQGWYRGPLRIRPPNSRIPRSSNSLKSFDSAVSTDDSSSKKELSSSGNVSSSSYSAGSNVLLTNLQQTKLKLRRPTLKPIKNPYQNKKSIAMGLTKAAESKLEVFGKRRQSMKSLNRRSLAMLTLRDDNRLSDLDVDYIGENSSENESPNSKKSIKKKVVKKRRSRNYSLSFSDDLSNSNINISRYKSISSLDTPSIHLANTKQSNSLASNSEISLRSSRNNSLISIQNGINDQKPISQIMEMISEMEIDRKMTTRNRQKNQKAVINNTQDLSDSRNLIKRSNSEVVRGVIPAATHKVKPLLPPIEKNVTSRNSIEATE